MTQENKGVPIHRAGIGMALAQKISPMELDHGTFGTSTPQIYRVTPQNTKKNIFPIVDYSWPCMSPHVSFLYMWVCLKI